MARASALRRRPARRAGAALVVALLTVGAVYHAVGRSAARPTPAPPFVGYWTAYGNDVTQLAAGETYAWGPSWSDSSSAVGTIDQEYQGISTALASATIATQVHARKGLYAYKPLLDVRTITPTAEWFSSYLRTVLLPVVTGTAFTQPDLIVLETELDGAIGHHYDAAWRSLIAALRRAGFHGKLLGTSSSRFIAGWWDDVDYVGGDFYPTIDTTTTAAATASWEAQVGWQVDAYAAGAHRPVLFGELGSYQGSLDSEQWHHYLDGLFLAMTTHPSWAGALFWSGWEGFSAHTPEPQTPSAPPVPAADALAALLGPWERSRT